MKTFQSFKLELEEALTATQRFKRKIHFQRSKPKRIAGLRRNKNRAIPTGGKEALRKQARRKFLTALKLRVRKDLSASKLQKQSPGAKAQIEKMVDRLKNTPAQKAKMSAFTRPGGKMYRDLISKRKDRISKMRAKK
tara:strand:- start:536 stop:946 length:411 start_codon:yes stop_codon:yes gene_type:complete